MHQQSDDHLTVNQAYNVLELAGLNRQHYKN